MENIVALDYGSKTLKAGFAYSFPSEDEPRVVTPSAVEILPTDEPSTSASGDHYPVHFPVNRGQITSFNELEALIHYSLYDLLGWEQGDEGNVVISEPLLTPKADREQLTQIMFEVFNTNGLFIQDQATLALYAVGKLSGCVVDIGHGKVDVSTITEGQVNTSSVRRLPFAGEDLTRYLEDLLHQRGISLHSTHDVEVLKELSCQAAESTQDYERLLSGGAASSSMPAPSIESIQEKTYELPDGQKISITSEGLKVRPACGHWCCMPCCMEAMQQRLQTSLCVPPTFAHWS